jgi:hypothetical protein
VLALLLLRAADGCPRAADQCASRALQLDRLGSAAEPHLAKLRDACSRIAADASFSICKAKA